MILRTLKHRAGYVGIKFPKHHVLPIQNEIVLTETASSDAESKDAGRRLVFEIRPKWIP